MPELAYVLLINRANTGLIDSALPDSPVVPARPPGRGRRLAATALHRLATRLNGGEVPQLGYAQPRSVPS